MEISGGSLVANSYLWFYQANASSQGGTIHVIGSKATEIKFNGLRYYNSYDQAKAAWAFTLDNGANHITKVQLTANFGGAGNARSGTLNVGLSGGVMLSGTNAMTLIEGPDILATSNFSNAADFEGATAKLWTQSIVDGATTDTLQVTLTGAASKGALDLAGSNSASFTASSYGYVNLTNVDLDNPLTLSLDITGGTLAKFTDSLTAAGIEWTTGSGDYEVALTLDPEVSGGTYFAWDMSGIDGAMGVQGVAIAAVPEPATWILLAGSLGMVAILRRRRFHGLEA